MNYIPPHIYFRFIVMMVSRDLLAFGFSIPEFIAQSTPEIVKGIGFHTLGYWAGALSERPFTSYNLLPPVITSATQTYDFIANSSISMPRTDRVAMLATFLSGAGLLTKTADPLTNFGAGSFIYVLFEYIRTLANSGGSGNDSIPFVVVRPNRRVLRRFSMRQHIECQLAIVAIFVIVNGCLFTVLVFAKKLIQVSKNYRFKQKRRIPKFLMPIKRIKKKKFLRILKCNPT